jgi:diguanylate cyclase (GGDEF)-like protein
MLSSNRTGRALARTGGALALIPRAKDLTMPTLFTARLKRLRSSVRDGNSDAVQDALTAQIQRDQFMSWVRHSYVMYPIGISAAIVLILYMRADWYDIWLRTAAISLLAGYLTMIIATRRILRNPLSSADGPAELTRLRVKLGAIRGYIGCSWGAVLLVMFTVSNPDQKCVLFGMSIAVLSTSVFGGSFIYGLTIWVPLMVSLLAAAWVIYPQTGVAPFVFLTLFGILTLFSIFDLSKKLKDFTISGFQLNSRNEIIKIVLNEFEEVASDWLWETNADMHIVNLSPRLASILHPAGPPLIPHVTDLRALVLQSLFAAQSCPDIETFVQRLTNREPFARLTLPITLHGEQFWWRLSGKPRFTARGDFIGYHGVASDVTESHGFHQRIEYIARHDALTGALNRARFNELLTEKFLRLDQLECGFCLISLDLDNFKLINDTYGHATGDEVLQIIAERIMQSVNFNDLVARIGGDEFYVLADCGTKHEGQQIAERIINDLNRPIILKDARILSGASAGLAYAPWDAREPKRILKQCDLALYHAKKKGRNIACVYDDMLEFEMQVRAQLESDLQAAIYQNQFELLYQPVLSLATGHIIGLEALIRWHHPTRGLIQPGDFIETAERTGLIEPIGRWVITEACRVAATLPAHIIMAINLSALQLRNPKIIELTEKTLAITGIEPARIEFEITETSLLDTKGSSLATVDALRALGVRFALDDFGTGHSSLSLLHRLKFDRLKIDRSFTAGMLKDKVNQTLVEKIIELSRALAIEVTVEGIETEAQANFLCKYEDLCVQGYLFGRPSRIADLSFTTPQTLPGTLWTTPASRPTNIVPLPNRSRDH